MKLYYEASLATAQPPKAPPTAHRGRYLCPYSELPLPARPFPCLSPDKLPSLGEIVEIVLQRTGISRKDARRQVPIRAVGTDRKRRADAVRLRSYVEQPTQDLPRSQRVFNAIASRFMASDPGLGRSTRGQGSTESACLSSALVRALRRTSGSRASWIAAN